MEPFRGKASGKTWRCRLGLHDEEFDIAYPLYKATCRRCGQKWLGLAFGSWKKVR